jgi:hypothetical protein
MRRIKSQGTKLAVSPGPGPDTSGPAFRVGLEPGSSSRTQRNLFSSGQSGRASGGVSGGIPAAAMSPGARVAAAPTPTHQPPLRYSMHTPASPADAHASSACCSRGSSSSSSKREATAGRSPGAGSSSTTRAAAAAAAAARIPLPSETPHAPARLSPAAEAAAAASQIPLPSDVRVPVASLVSRFNDVITFIDSAGRLHARFADSVHLGSGGRAAAEDKAASDAISHRLSAARLRTPDAEAQPTPRAGAEAAPQARSWQNGAHANGVRSSSGGRAGHSDHIPPAGSRAGDAWVRPQPSQVPAATSAFAGGRVRISNHAVVLKGLEVVLRLNT